jgi:hypothetical protein
MHSLTATFVMTVRIKYLMAILALALGTPLAIAPPACAAPPHTTLLPDTTTVYLHAISLRDVEERWNQVQFGQIFADENMAAFREQWRRFVDAKLQSYTQTTGLTLHELIDFATGGVSVAVVPDEDGKAVYIVLADVGDKQQEAQRLITEAGRRLHAGGAMGSVRQAGPIQFVAYRAAPEGEPAREAAFVLHEDLFGVSTGIAAMDDLARRWNGGGLNGLSEREAFRRTMSVCSCEPDDGLPQSCGFIDPIAYLRLINPPGNPTLDRRDPVEFLTKHGVDAIRGVGGVVSLANGTTDVTLRLAVYAPRPYRGAMNMVRLPACRNFVPPEWLTDDVNMFASINLDLTAVLDHLGPVFDDVVGDGVEGTFDEILSDLAAEDGPQVDVRKDLVAHLGPRLLLVSDAASADDPRSERSLIAVQSTDEEAVALAIKKLLRDDPGVRRFRLSAMDNDLWEIGEDSGGPGSGGQPKITSSAVMVHNGHVLLATNAHLIRKLVESGRAPDAKLKAADDLRRLEACLARYTPGECVGRVYSRTARDLRATYETLRQGGDRPSESIAGIMVGKLLAAIRDPRTGELPIDFTTLPPYDMIADRLGWIGATGKNMDDGWYVVGVALPPEAR